MTKQKQYMYRALDTQSINLCVLCLSRRSATQVSLCFSLLLCLQTRHQCRSRGFLIIRGCKEEEVAELTLAKVC